MVAPTEEDFDVVVVGTGTAGLSVVAVARRQAHASWWSNDPAGKSSEETRAGLNPCCG